MPSIETDTTRLPKRVGFAFFLSVVAIQLSMEYINQYGPYYLHPPEETGRTVFMSLALIGVAFFAGRALDVVSDIIIGAMSDRRSVAAKALGPRGRRRPFIFWGSIPLAVTTVLFWYQPYSGESVWNFAYTAVLLQLHWTFLTLCAVPLYALVPEIARTPEARSGLGAWIGAGTTVGVLIAIALAGEGVAALDPARTANPDGGQTFSSVGYQRVGLIFALVSLVCFQWLVWSVREPERVATISTPSWSQSLGGLRNPRFLKYFLVFFLLNIGFLAPQRILPHWVEVALKGDESTVAFIMLPYLITSLMSSAVSPLLAKRMSPKRILLIAIGLVAITLPWMYVIGVADADFQTKRTWALILFAFSGLANGLLYVIIFPLIGAITDEEERRSGIRRDAVYFAFNNMTWKAGIAVSIVLSTVSLDWFGNSVSKPLGIYLVGPIGAVFAALSFALATRYPADK